MNSIVKMRENDYNFVRCSGRGAARLARLHGVQEVEGSNPFAPTIKIKHLGHSKRGGLFAFWGNSFFVQASSGLGGHRQRQLAVTRRE